MSKIDLKERVHTVVEDIEEMENIEDFNCQNVELTTNINGTVIEITALIEVHNPRIKLLLGEERVAGVWNEEKYSYSVNNQNFFLDNLWYYFKDVWERNICTD